MKEATGNSVLKAWSRAAKRLATDDLLAASESAGFIFPNGQKQGEREGFQVMVTVYKYSDQLAARSPNSAGLLAREQELNAKK